MGYAFVKVEREGPLTLVTINRPEVMNALHPPANQEMEAVFDAFAADPEQWVAIVTGEGYRAFSAGNDLRYQAENRGPMVRPKTGFGGLTSRFDLTKPVIAAVNGVAMGGGFEIALACDLIIASQDAVFALPEPRVGLAALAGGLHRLPRQIGEKAAMGMILTGRRVSAAEGVSLGFVNETAPKADLMAAARRWAALILECGPLSIRASKDAVQRGLAAPSLEAAIAGQNAYPAVAALYGSEDFIEGPLAFAQKRPPQWKGR
jgi:enoyl-CoA hydratase/carnithine racemase